MGRHASGSLRRHYPDQVCGSFALTRKTLSVTDSVIWLPSAQTLGRNGKRVKLAKRNLRWLQPENAQDRELAVSRFRIR